MCPTTPKAYVQKTNYSRPLLCNTHIKTTSPRQLYFSRSSTKRVGQKTKKRKPGPTSQILEPPRFAHFPKPVRPNLEDDFPCLGPKKMPLRKPPKRRLGGVRVPKNPFGPIWMCKKGPRGKRFSLKFPKAQKKSPRHQRPKKKNRNLLASESVKNLIFQFRTLAKIFPPPTSEMRETVRRNTQNAKKG